MNDFLSAFLKIVFAGILGIATLLTTIILSPLLAIFWLWKKLTPPPK